MQAKAYSAFSATMAAGVSIGELLQGFQAQFVLEVPTAEDSLRRGCVLTGRALGVGLEVDLPVFRSREVGGGEVLADKCFELLAGERNLKKSASQRVQTPVLLTKQDGTPLTYEALSNAWMDGMKRSGVTPTIFRDLRAKALTDKSDRASVRTASDLAIHATKAQTTSYVRRTKARKTGAAA